ncbi:MAG: hypothetical protein H7288_11545 [Kineosporiaceae bacterium]|nr:hypothetical protein [Aeromicrobium sp.]
MALIEDPTQTPIAYDGNGAVRATGISRSTLEKEVRDGNLTVRYVGTKRMYGHAELLEWFNHLPVDRPVS